MRKPDFTGYWTLKFPASRLSPAIAPLVQGGFAHIEHNDPMVSVHLSITWDGTPFDVRFERESVWDDDVLEFTDRMPTPNGEMMISFRYEILNSGRRLRATEVLRAPDREQDNVWVFDRAELTAN